MSRTSKITIIVVLALAVGAVITFKETNKTRSEFKTLENPGKDVSGSKSSPNEAGIANEPKVLPRLVDLGAGKCIPCKMMKPILEELKSQYKGRLEVVFIDVWENPNEAKKYKISIIPTQIFYDATGKELFRHEGFFSKEDILSKWKELGFDFNKK